MIKFVGLFRIIITMKFDETDINLLELLQSDSKKTTKEYALKHAIPGN